MMSVTPCAPQPSTYSGDSTAALARQSVGTRHKTAACCGTARYESWGGWSTIVSGHLSTPPATGAHTNSHWHRNGSEDPCDYAPKPQCEPAKRAQQVHSSWTSRMHWEAGRRGSCPGHRRPWGHGCMWTTQMLQPWAIGVPPALVQELGQVPIRR